MDSIPQAGFPLGQIVHHRLFDYRGVVYDVDPVFMLPEAWYDQVALSRPPKDEPWYRVLVDGSVQETYVAQRNLEPAADKSAIRHPEIERYFGAFEAGRYRVRHEN